MTTNRKIITKWQDGRFLVDRRFLSDLLGVSVRTVRRYCEPARNELDQVVTDFPTGTVLYDAMKAQFTLAGVIGRPDRTATAIRVRIAQAAEEARQAAKRAGGAP